MTWMLNGVTERSAGEMRAISDGSWPPRGFDVRKFQGVPHLQKFALEADRNLSGRELGVGLTNLFLGFRKVGNRSADSHRARIPFSRLVVSFLCFAGGEMEKAAMRILYELLGNVFTTIEPRNDRARTWLDKLIMRSYTL